AVVNWIPPIASDNCGTPTVTSTHTPGASFGVGVTAVTYTATDSVGNTATCSFNVTVLDNQLPSLGGCPTNQAVMAAPGQCSGSATWIPPVASDNCGAPVLTSTHAPG